MSKPSIFSNLSDTLHLAECNDGFWLYDDTRNMNLALREPTKDAALLKALAYYQDRLKQVESEYAALQLTVDTFLKQLKETNNDQFDLLPEE